MNKDREKNFEREDISLQKEIESEDVNEELIESKNIQSLFSIIAREGDLIEGEASYKQFINKTKKKQARKLVFKIMQYAAAAALLIGSTWSATTYFMMDQNELAYNELYVPERQRAYIKLSDETTVWLNSRSKLTYPSQFSGGERRVTLEGEALFEVSKNSEKPFIVSAKSMDIKVLGTKFNVSSYPESDFASTSLIEGRVEIYDKVNLSNVITLHPNQKVVYSNGAMKIEIMKYEDYFSWIDGIYSFDNASLEEIMAKLELYYGVTIKITNNQILKYKYTGKFRQQDTIEEILKRLQIIHKFNIKKDEDSNKYILS